MTTLTTKWGKHTVTLTWVPATELTDNFHVTSTHGFCFHEGKVVLVNLDTRGWDIPGGHMEAGETPEECFAREAMEEATITGNAQMIGYILVDNRKDPHFIPGKYPEVGRQVYYRMDVEEYLPFQGVFEASERKLVEVSEVPAHHDGWNEIMDAIFAEAVKTSVDG